MKKLLLTLAAIPAATMAVEASAQTYVNTNATAGVQNRIMNLEARYQAAVNARVLTDNERIVIGRQLAELRNLQQQYAYNGLTASERRTLQTRIRNVRDQLRAAGGAGWANRYGWSDRELDVYGNAYGYGYGNSGVTYDRYGRPVVTQGYTVDQYGRTIPNGYYGQGGPYEPAYTPRSSNGIGNVLGGVLGSVVGGGGGVLGNVLGGGNIGIGSVITGALANVLGGGDRYGYQDRSNVYFRTDGQRVYEIDARTNQVIRIHPVR
jgi:hypothetical protein